MATWSAAAMAITFPSSAAVIAQFLRRRGIDRVFGLCGGHIMPLWMCLDAEGIRIIDVRDERSAVHMAQAHAEITGQLGVALVTAGPGVTNAMTGIANANASKAPVLILSGMTPSEQENRGGLQDLNHTLLLSSITRYARTVRVPDRVLPELNEAAERAYGHGGDPGPVYLDFPTDTLRALVSIPTILDEYFDYRPKQAQPPCRLAVAGAVDHLFRAKRPLVISGRGARSAAAELIVLLDLLKPAYLDTGESRGLIPEGHRSVVSALRAKAMYEADAILTVGRRLDFQLAYGSPAVFGDAIFVRIADAPSELRDNRRGIVEILADPALTLAALNEEMRLRPLIPDRDWVSRLRVEHIARVSRHVETLKAIPTDENGRIHPNFLLATLQEKLDRDCILCLDGGDFLSFARVGLTSSTVLDPGPFGCIGVGLPYGIAASLAYPDRQVVVATGDGSFGFNAMEIDTAVRHRASPLIVVANNGAWQIEVHDQQSNYGKVVGTKLRTSDYAGMARALGMYAERIDTVAGLPAAIDRALANRPALLDVLVSPIAVSADAKSGLATVPDLQALVAWEIAEKAWREP